MAPTPELPILVTGASGFLGEHLTRRLVAMGLPVVGTYQTHPIQIVGLDARFVDLSNAEATKVLIDEIKPRTVFHTAALTNVGYCEEHPAEARAAIVDVTRNLIEALREIDAKTSFVLVSTDQVYNGVLSTESGGYREQDEAKPLSTYGRLKLEAEGLVRELPLGSIIRSALIYGPGTTHKQSFLAWMLGNLAKGEPVTLFTDEFRTPIYVDDLIDGMIALASHRETGLWLAGGGDSLSRLAMGEVACDLHGYAESLLRPSRLADSDYPAPRPANVCLDSTKLMRLVGRPFQTFRVGLEEIKRTKGEDYFLRGLNR